MADNVTVSNSPVSSNTDIPVRTLEKAGYQTQVVAVDYGGSGSEDLTVPDFATETTLQQVSNSLAGELNVVVPGDILGANVMGIRANQLEINLETTFDPNLITNTKTTTGTFTNVNGHAEYTTGTDTNGSAIGTSVQIVKYRPGYEQYAFFTAAFTTPTATTSYQRIGAYDANNGFFIGYNGLTFGIAHRSATVDTHVTRASWNGDSLDGSTGSLFTRNGSPEAIDFTKSNLYRIRWAWLGSGPCLFEVLSPDGKFVTFHTIKFPNLQLDPSIQIPDLPMKLEVVKISSDATNLKMYTACWAAGTNSPLRKITDTIDDFTLADISRAVLTGRSSTGGGTYYNVKVNPSGSLITAVGDIDGVAGQAAMANSLPVVIASDQTPLRASTATLTNVTASASSVQLLASNGNRKGGIFVNDADQVCYLKFGTTASATSFTYKIAAGGTIELPSPVYTGQIDAIWAGSPTGAMRITEV